jgi:Na+/phosphate symporter
MWLSVALIFIIVGVLFWAVSANPKISELGRMTAQAGLIILCWSLSGHFYPLLR